MIDTAGTLDITNTPRKIRKESEIKIKMIRDIKILEATSSLVQTRYAKSFKKRERNLRLILLPRVI